jgi:poly-gamma-glutamate capsule biosynthesis protein CapA/YwtB (metallophosphatase superfamily)
MKVALAGDTMLGRGVARALEEHGPKSLVAPEVVAAAAEADLFVLNLECCISRRGTPWPDPRKPFFFRAPPAGADALARLGVDCVTLANNHALDFGREALLDTFEHLRAVGVRWVGAGASEAEARAPVVLEARGLRLAVVAMSDHPPEYAARGDRAGIAFGELAGGRLPAWLAASPHDLDADAVLVTPHWGPNMTARPTAHVRAAAAALADAGATLVAGHSAHVFHGIEGAILYDLGDFLDDYAVHKTLRNDLGLLFLVSLDERGPIRLEAVPLRLEFCHTRLATGEDAAWIARRFERACGELGTEVSEEDGRLIVAWR